MTEWIVKYEIQVPCVGRPSEVKDDEGQTTRIACKSTRVIALEGKHTMSQQKRAVDKAIKDAGWSKLTTIGERVYLCKGCSRDVVLRRKVNKHIWGTHSSQTHNKVTAEATNDDTESNTDKL